MSITRITDEAGGVLDSSHRKLQIRVFVRPANPNGILLRAPQQPCSSIPVVDAIGHVGASFPEVARFPILGLSVSPSFLY
jgi:hypothetical protein